MNPFWIFNIIFLIGASTILGVGLTGELRQYLHPRFHIALSLSAAALILFALDQIRTKQYSFNPLVLGSWILLIISIAYSFQSPPPPPRVEREVQSSSSVAVKPSSITTAASAGIQKRSRVSILSSSSLPEIHAVQSSTSGESIAILKTNIPWLATQVREDKWNYLIPIEVKGQIFRSDELDKNGEIGIHRPLVTCCVADLISIAFRMPVDSLQNFIDKEWIIVHGLLQSRGDQDMYRTRDRRMQFIFMDKAYLLPDHIDFIDVSVPDPYIFYTTDSKDFQEMY